MKPTSKHTPEVNTLTASGEGAEQYEQAYRRHLQQAREAWPQLEACHHVAARLEERGALAAFIERKGRLHITDLYLAGCIATGDAVALQLFDAVCMPTIQHALTQMFSGTADREEVMGHIRYRLLVGAPNDSAPRILQYRGQSTLQRWLRMTGIKMALQHKRNRKKFSPLAPDHLAAQVTAAGQELATIKNAARPICREAFVDALAVLSKEDRLLLTHQIVDGLSVQELSLLHNVHRTTIWRTLERIHATLRDRTRRRVGEQLALTQAETDSLIGLMMSQLAGSLCHMLQEADPAEEHPPQR